MAHTVGELLIQLMTMPRDAQISVDVDSVVHIHHSSTSVLIPLPRESESDYTFTWHDKVTGTFRGTKACMAGFLAIRQYHEGKPQMLVYEAGNTHPITYAYRPHYHPLSPGENMTYEVVMTHKGSPAVRLGSDSIDFLRGLKMAVKHLHVPVEVTPTRGTPWYHLMIPEIMLTYISAPESTLDSALPTTRVMAKTDELNESLIADLEEMGFDVSGRINGFIRYCPASALRARREGHEDGYDLLYSSAMAYFGQDDEKMSLISAGTAPAASDPDTSAKYHLASKYYPYALSLLEQRVRTV